MHEENLLNPTTTYSVKVFKERKAHGNAPF